MKATRQKPESPTKKERFDILYGTLRAYNDRFVKGVLSVTGALLVLIGWLLTSNSVLTTFKTSTALTIVCIAVIAALIYVYVSSISRVYNVNCASYERLKALGYIDEDYYSSDLLPFRYYVFGLAINIWNYLFIAILIAHARWS